MSVERDELADEFTGHVVGFGAYPKKLMRGHAQEIATRILAAGYQKPNLPLISARALEEAAQAIDEDPYDELDPFYAGWLRNRAERLREGQA